MRLVKNKIDFVQRYRAGEFGNASPTWDTVGQLVNAVETGTYKPMEGQKFHLRNRKAGAPTHYDQTYKDVYRVFDKAKGTPDPCWYVSAMAPHHLGLVQGEIRIAVGGLELRWTTAKKPMRDAMAEGSETLSGLRAKHFLLRSMNEKSWDWTQWLLEEYPAHIVEFTTFSRCWGTVPGYNTVFWEVRPDRAMASNLSAFTEVY